MSANFCSKDISAWVCCCCCCNKAIFIFCSRCCCCCCNRVAFRCCATLSSCSLAVKFNSASFAYFSICSSRFLNSSSSNLCRDSISILSFRNVIVSAPLALFFFFRFWLAILASLLTLFKGFQTHISLEKVLPVFSSFCNHLAYLPHQIRILFLPSSRPLHLARGTFRRLFLPRKRSS